MVAAHRSQIIYTRATEASADDKPEGGVVVEKKQKGGKKGKKAAEAEEAE